MVSDEQLAPKTTRGNELLTGGSTGTAVQINERDIQIFVAGYRARELDVRWDDKTERIARRKARRFLQSPRWQA